MDVGITNLVQIVNDAVPRPLGKTGGAHIAPINGRVETSSASVLPMSVAYPSSQVPDIGVASVIDRVRADFETFRLRLEQGRDAQIAAQVSDNGTGNIIADMQEAMDRSMRTQVNILELGVTLNAGITAAQQSQGSVKTLLEKS